MQKETLSDSFNINATKAGFLITLSGLKNHQRKDVCCKSVHEF